MRTFSYLFNMKWIQRSVILLCGLFMLAACSEEKRGCIDPNAPNYDPEAVVSSGNCGYPSSEKRTLLTLVNNTTNDNCGQFGIPLFNQSLSQFPGKVIPLMIHPSEQDPLYSGTAVNLTGNYNVLGFPDIIAGNMAGALSQQLIVSGLQASLNEPVIVNVNANKTKVGDSIEIDLYGLFYQETAGDYYSTAYLVEKNVSQAQAGINDPSYKHNHVLRAGGNGAFGFLVASGAIEARESFKKSFKIFMNPQWNYANLTLVSVVWKDDGTAFKLMNVNVE